MAPSRLRRALRERGRCARAAPAAPRRGLPARSGPLCPSLSTSFFSTSPPSLIFLPSSLLLLYLVFIFFQKQISGAASGRRVSPSRELFPAWWWRSRLLVAEPPPSPCAPPPPRAASALGGSGRLPETRARPLGACPVARSPGRPAGAAPRSAAARQRPAGGGRAAWGAGEPRVLPGWDSCRRRLTRLARPHVFPFVSPALQGQIVGQLVLLWVSSKLIRLCCVEGLEGSRFLGTSC